MLDPHYFSILKGVYFLHLFQKVTSKCLKTAISTPIFSSYGGSKGKILVLASITIMQMVDIFLASLYFLYT